MKRDMDLIKALLLVLEESGSLNHMQGYSDRQVGYHVALLEDAKLITQEWYFNTDVSAAMLSGTRMTWEGHEFLDSCRDSSIWEKAKKITISKTGSLTFEVLKSVLIQLGKDAVSNLSGRGDR